MLNLVLTLGGSWRAKNTLKLSSKYLIDRIYKIKQHLNYINLRYKSKYSSNPKDILKSAKKNYEKLYTKETTSKAATTDFLSKIHDRKKMSNENFNSTLFYSRTFFFLVVNASNHTKCVSLGNQKCEI